ncbi:L,D-transpeptidase family protein [Chelatococcus sambhunathii]|uniref:L,D-transpeptidase family protein n=1 Tax=Chelatococcus sambhunathii TaxID=363953 RepID=A0ABU1DIE5_9HYPH|nr:L,D-transpeptidase family protein [Chelatococcus sambhunathii]MDR4307876.1 L,D-transpeptidase family protein [Chelatococcus sambhunathii]
MAASTLASGRRRPFVMRASGLFGAAAMCALIVGSAQAENRADPVAAAAPDPLYNPPAVGDRDFSTGALADPAATPAPAATAPAQSQPPAPELTNLAPLPAAVMATLGDPAFKLSQGDRDALKTFYAARQGAPFWISNDRFTDKAEAAKARIAKAAEDGLDPKAFKLPAPPADATPSEVAQAEIRMSVAALAYGRQAWGGRITPSSISPLVTAQPTPFDAQAALASLDQSHDVAATLDGFNPQHPQFQELRKLLAAARGAQGEVQELPRIPAGKLLEPGGEDPRVPALRKRLGLSGAPDDLYYDSELEQAVVAFQKQNKIGASGLVNKVTIRALNAGSHPRGDAELIELNMERWRWMPRDLGAKHVFVDIPVFRLHIMEDGRSTYDTRVIVGKATNQTPVFSDEIDHIVVNPYWNVPSTIALKEMQGSSLRGFEVVDSRGRKVEDFSWEDVKANRVRIRQPPGERNALGHIKFMFPNKHSVYLHDTSSRSLFEKSARAMSHGCVRVDRPLEFADALSGDQGLSGSKLKSMIGGKERSLTLSRKIPVHLTYFTAWVDPNGKLETRDDLYGLDGRLRLALRGEPLPPLPKDEAPRVIAKPKPKPKPAPAPEETVASAVPAPAPERPKSVNWIHRLFGVDSR